MRKTNYRSGKNDYFRIQRTMGMKLDKNGNFVPNVRSFYGRSRKEAEKKYQAALNASKNGSESINSQPKCFGQLIDEWVSQTFLPSPDFADGTKYKYLNAYKKTLRASNLAGMKLSDIRAKDLQEYYNNLNEYYSVRRSLHNLLSAFFKYAVCEELCTRNLTQGLTVYRDKAPKIKGDIDVWPKNELKKLLKALEGNRLHFLVLVAVNTGLRIGELLSLEHSDIKDGKLYVSKQVLEIHSSPDGHFSYSTGSTHRVKKYKSYRAIPLTAKLLEELDSYLEWQKKDQLENNYSTNLLFSTSNGTYYYKRNVRRSIDRVCCKNNIPRHKFHAFRATFATNLCAENVPIEVCKYLMGHQNVETTLQYYVKVDEDRCKTALNKILTYSFE